jgi:hypothetical protein
MPIAPMTKTANDVIAYVTRAFGDESGAQITDADIIRWINSGQSEINKENKILKATATTPLVIGTRSYTFPTPNILEIEVLQVDGKPLQYMSFKEANEYITSEDPTFTATGTPWLWYEWGGDILVYPTPDAVLTLTLYYIKYPDPIAAGVDTLNIPDSYFESLLQYCLSQAYEQDDDWTGSANKQQQFKESLTKLSDDGSRYNRQFYPTITVLDEDYC